MKIEQVSLLIETGTVTRAIITAAPMVPGKWIIQIERKTGEVIPLTARRENIRNFASIDSAVKVLNTLGCKFAEVDWSGQL